MSDHASQPAVKPGMRHRWIKIGGLLVAILLAGNALVASASAALAYRAPAVVLMLDASHPFAIFAANEMAAKDFLDPHPSTKVERSAAVALAREPLNAGLVRQFALALPASTSIQRRNALVGISERLSRRDVPGQYYLMGVAARNGDARATVLHIDTMLRTRREIWPVGFMALSKGLADPQLRAAARPVLAKNPPWLAEFLIFATANAERPEWVVDALGEIPRLPQSADFASASLQLLQRLADSGRAEALATLYRKIPDSDPALLDSIAISTDADEAQLAPIAWHLIQNSDFSAVLQNMQQGSANAIAVQVLAGKQGTVARKVVYLKPGRYGIGFTLAAVSGGAALRLQVTCLDQSEPLLDLERKPAVAGMGRADFVVPEGCPAQWVRISVANLDQAADATLEVRAITLDK